MANLKEIRNRITSVSSTKQITSAMKMVSAAKLKRATNAIVQMRPYSTKLTEIIQNLTVTVDASDSIYSRLGDVRNILIIPLASNKGLCGGFNTNIIKATNRLIAEYKEKNVNISILPAGRKAVEYYKKFNYKISSDLLPENLNHLVNETSFVKSSAEADRILTSFAEKQYDKVYLIYNRFKNAAVQDVMTEQFLPIVLPKADASKGEVNYIFEPSQQEILEHLVPKALRTQLFKAFIDSNASEHGARMTAMHKATDNASELIKDLKLKYNKARQAAITGEILEIVAGAEALNG